MHSLTKAPKALAATCPSRVMNMMSLIPGTMVTCCRLRFLHTIL
jgi:hypothetical protein